MFLWYFGGQFVHVHNMFWFGHFKLLEQAVEVQIKSIRYRTVLCT